jgi:hypothetical protein
MEQCYPDRRIVTMAVRVRVIRLNQLSEGGKHDESVLEITMKIAPENRPHAGEVYSKYREPFLSDIPGAKSKDLLLRTEDVQVLHGFDSKAKAESYLGSTLFQKDVVTALKPYLMADPEIRIYECA